MTSTSLNQSHTFPVLVCLNFASSWCSLSLTRNWGLKGWEQGLCRYHPVSKRNQTKHKGKEVIIFFSFIFLSWRLIALQYCFTIMYCHTLTWISHGVTCISHPDPPSHLPLYPIPLGLPSAPGPSTWLMHPTWAGDMFQMCKTEKETQMYRTDFWTLWEKARVGCFERTASKHV